MVLDCFQELFSTSHPSTQDVEKVVWCIEKRLTDSMKSSLLAPYSADEDIRPANYGQCYCCF